MASGCPAIYSIFDQTARCQDTNDSADQISASSASSSAISNSSVHQEAAVSPLRTHRSNNLQSNINNSMHIQTPRNVSFRPSAHISLPRTFFPMNPNVHPSLPYYPGMIMNHAMATQHIVTNNQFYHIPTNLQTQNLQTQWNNTNFNIPFFSSLSSIGPTFALNNTNRIHPQSIIPNCQEPSNKKQKNELPSSEAVPNTNFKKIHQDSRGEKTIYQFLQQCNIINSSSRDFASDISDDDKHQMKRDIFKLNGGFEVVNYKSSSSQYKKITKVQTMRCQNPKCLIKYAVLRDNNHFGYYASDGVHDHPQQKNTLSDPLIRIIREKYQSKNGTTEVMSTLLGMDEKMQSDVLGDDAGALKMNDTRTKLRIKIRNQMSKLKSQDKNYSGTMAPSNSRRTVVEIVKDIEDCTVDFSKLLQEHGILSEDQVTKVFPDMASSDIGKYYTSSDYGKDMSGKYTHVQWVKYNAIRTAFKTLQLCEKTGNPMLMQTDYTHSKMSDKGVLGITGVADMHRQYHAITFDYNKTENAAGSLKMIKTTLDLLKLCGYKEERHGKVYIIMDGSDKLRKACEDLGCIPLRCAVHIFRLPDLGKGMKGHSGTAGSLLKFMKRYCVPDRTACTIRMAMYSFFYFPDEKTYKKGRELFLHDYENGDFYGLDKKFRSENSKFKNQLFSFYLPGNPEWGYAATKPGQVTCTNG